MIANASLKMATRIAITMTKAETTNVQIITSIGRKHMFAQSTKDSFHLNGENNGNKFTRICDKTLAERQILSHAMRDDEK